MYFDFQHLIVFVIVLTKILKKLNSTIMLSFLLVHLGPYFLLIHHSIHVEDFLPYYES